LTTRPEKTLAANAREGIIAEWTRDACLVGVDVGGSGHYGGNLSRSARSARRPSGLLGAEEIAPRQLLRL
jgi:hypothetical protein